MSDSPLPIGWTSASLSGLVTPRRNRVAPTSAPDARFIGMEHVEAHSMRILETVPAGSMKSSAAAFESGDVLYGRLRPYLNKVVRPDFAGLCSAEFIVLPDTQHLRSAFLQYRLNSADFVSFASHLDEGDRPRVDFEQIGTFTVLLPPEPEQRRIVAKIEELFSDLDAGVAALERVKANLKRYRAAVLKAAVEGRLTEDWRRRHPDTEPAAKLLERILADRRAKWELDQLRKFKEAGKTPPKGWKERYKQPPPAETKDLAAPPPTWCWASIEQLSTKVVDGVHRKPNYVATGIPFVTVRNLTAGPGISFENLNYVTQADHREFSKRTDVQRGDILITKDGTLGVVRVVRTDAAFSIFVSVALVKPVNYEYSEYLGLAMSSLPVQRQMVPKGSGLQHIHLEDLRCDAVPLPPLAEQIEIVTEVDRRLSVVDAAEQQVEHAVKRAGRLRQAILTRAFRGQLVPQDPKDEPASRLLQRIESTMPRKQKPSQAHRSTKQADKPKNAAKRKPPPTLPAEFVTNILELSPTIRLVAIKYAGGFRSLSPLDLELRPAPSMDKSISPLCLVGLNGSGKSNLIELLGLLLCDIELSLIDYTRIPQIRRSLAHPPFAIKYELRTGDKNHAMVTLTGGKGESLRATVVYQDSEFSTTSSRDIQRLLPKWIIAYSSGLNETISLPFMRNRAYYSEEVSNRAGKEAGVLPVHDIRTVFLDYECNAAILLSNYVFQQDERADLFRKALRIQSLTSFALTYRLKRPKGGSPVRLTHELRDILARFRAAATNIEEREDVTGATLRFDLENGAASALRKKFKSAIEFFQCIHKWALLNSLSLSGAERKFYLHTPPDAGLLAQPPTVSREDQIFRVDDLQVRLVTPDRVIPYAGLSDGEHQFIQVFGSIMLFDKAGTLFLLDEPETHFNPQWRRQFVENLNRLKTTLAQEFVVSTHSPFVVSGCHGNGVFVFSRKGDTISIVRVDFETFGSSYELLLMKLFGVETTIAERAAHEMRDILKSKDPKQIESAAGRFGDSWEKQLIYRRIAELEQEHKSA